MTTIISNLRLIGKPRNEDWLEIVVEIGTPKESNGAWACAVSVKPLYPNLHEIYGDNSMQSLCLGISFVLDLLANFIGQGGQLFYENDEPFDFAPYAFGVLKRR